MKVYTKGSIPAPHNEGISIENYRVLHDVKLSPLTPLTTLLGPNGSGKSTVLYAFAFLSECFSVSLSKAWDRQGRFKELRSRGSTGPIVFEVRYREKPKSPIITYHLAIDESAKGPFVSLTG